MTMKLKGTYQEVVLVTFPHKTVLTHGDHMIYVGGARGPAFEKVVRCDGTVKGAQG